MTLPEDPRLSKDLVVVMSTRFFATRVSDLNSAGQPGKAEVRRDALLAPEAGETPYYALRLRGESFDLVFH
jgi:hypothetical protein